MKKIHLSPRTSNQTKSARREPSTTLQYSEFLFELQSAASMIMSREECESLAKEVAALRQAHPVAA